MAFGNARRARQLPASVAVFGLIACLLSDGAWAVELSATTLAISNQDQTAPAAGTTLSASPRAKRGPRSNRVGDGALANEIDELAVDVQVEVVGLPVAVVGISYRPAPLRARGATIQGRAYLGEAARRAIRSPGAVTLARDLK